jgi:hypothetical protein
MQTSLSWICHSLSQCRVLMQKNLGLSCKAWVWRAPHISTRLRSCIKPSRKATQVRRLIACGHSVRQLYCTTCDSSSICLCALCHRYILNTSNTNTGAAALTHRTPKDAHIALLLTPLDTTAVQLHVSVIIADCACEDSLVFCCPLQQSKSQNISWLLLASHKAPVLKHWSQHVVHGCIHV